jgi:D-glycero-alpha-D-manno-heptose 1-phosphate guanylyltransferase
MIDALVLAGGRGTRLAAVVPELPKPMAPVCGRPFLELLLGALHDKGLQRAVLSLGYRAEVIVQHFGTRFRGLELDYVIEEQPLGTGGAIRLGLAKCRGDAALVVNGDTLLDLELQALHARWLAVQRPILVGCQVPNTTRYGRLQVERGRLTGFAEKGLSGPGWINSGHYVLPRGLLETSALPPAFSFENDVLVPRLAELQIEVFESAGDFIDIGIPEDYARAQTVLQRWAHG